jgi:serine/threonine protein kinase
MADEQTPVIDQEERERGLHLSEQSLRPPTAVPGYEAEQFLGRGAFGQVWLAVERNTGRRVAIKFYTNRGGLDWSLLSREVEKLRFLFGDRHVVQLVEVGWDANPPYYIMEYLEQGSLEQLLEKGLPTVPEAVALFREVATGLGHAHGKGILHCDLKPANILLDQYLAPRLADFGQARLSNEQAAALGTVFYMAPEQADLKAAPDVRWDVYALGAVMYRLLTGEPPYRGEEMSRELRKADTLEERLTRYRQFIHKAPPPSAHRGVRGVDRSLAAIIDRCLARKPERRYPNVQAVLNALDQRALQRAKRPLLVLGGVGPVLLLLVISLFAWHGFRTAVNDSYRSLAAYSLESNRLSAKFAADTVNRRISQRWGILEQQAASPRLLKLLADADGKPRASRQREELQQYLDTQFDQYRPTATSSSWFLLDERGKLLALSPAEMRQTVVAQMKTKVVDQSFAHRDFFHGGGKDLDEKEAAAHPPKPLDRPHHSRVIESKLKGNPRRIIFSVPIRSRAGGRSVGVLGMGVDLGKFAELQIINDPSQTRPGEQVSEFATLVETRPDWNNRRGLILQHPELERLGKVRTRLPLVYLSRGQLAELEEALNKHPGELVSLPDYRDPFAEKYEEFQGRWVVVAKPVVVEWLERPGNKAVRIPTGWVVLVQERHAGIVQPVQELRAKLIREGVLALGMTLVLLAGLWGFVILVFGDSSRSRLAAFFRRRAGLPSGSFPSHTGAGSTRSASLRTGDGSGGVGTTVTQSLNPPG